MIEKNSKTILKLFKALDADWAVCDDNDEDDFMVMVNAARDEHPTLSPKKELIAFLEEGGFIIFDEKDSDPKGKKRESYEFYDETIIVPFVYFYHVSEKGRQLSRDLTQNPLSKLASRILS